METFFYCHDSWGGGGWRWEGECGTDIHWLEARDTVKQLLYEAQNRLHTQRIIHSKCE